MTKKHEYQEIQGFIVFNNHNDLVELPSNQFSSSIKHYINAAINENKDIAKVWENISVDLKTFESVDNREKYSLIEELIEYYILQKISFLISNNFKSKSSHTFNTDNIPSLLRANRYLSLFSKPLNSRIKSQSFSDGIPVENEKVKAAYKEGILYEKFELITPPNSKLQLSHEGYIHLQTPCISLKIKVEFDAVGTYLPEGFLDRIAKDNYEYFKPYAFLVSFQLQKKLSLIFSSLEKEYFKAIVIALNELTDKLDQDKYFKRINWESINIMLNILKPIDPHRVSQLF